MKNAKKAISLIVCLVVVIFLFPISASAEVATEEKEIRSSYIYMATAKATLETKTSSVLATLNYEAMASTMTINLHSHYRNTDGDVDSLISMATDKKTGYLFATATAPSGTTFYSAQAYLNLTTALDAWTFDLTDPVG